MDEFFPWRKPQDPNHKKFKFSDIDLSHFRIMTFKNFSKYGKAISSDISYFLGYAVDVHIAITLMQADTTLYPKAHVSGIAYIAFTALSLALLAYYVFMAIDIISSGYVSYCYIQTEAYLISSIRSYDHFCFMSKLTSNIGCKNKLVLYVYSNTYQLPQLMVTKVPQTVLIMLNTDALQTLAKNTQNSGIPGSQVSAIMKLILLYWELAFTGMTVLVLYFCLRCCVTKGNLGDYAHDLIEKRVEALLTGKSGKGSIKNPADFETEKDKKKREKKEKNDKKAALKGGDNGCCC